MEPENKGSVVNSVTKPEDIRVLVDFPKFIYTSIADQIKQADTKAVGILSIIGIVTAALLNRLSALKGSVGINHPMWVFIFAFSIIMLVLCMKSVIRVVYPRSTKGKHKNLIYFQDIASFSQEEYKSKGKSLSANEILDEVYSNTHNLAKIANSKYGALRQAMILTVITIVWTVAVLLLS